MAVAVFLLFAANFLYFFVDDEAIPFVYASHLVAGNGLTYDPAVGPDDGFSDFLMVWVDAGILTATRSPAFPGWRTSSWASCCRCATAR